MSSFMHIESLKKYFGAESNASNSNFLKTIFVSLSFGLIFLGILFTIWGFSENPNILKYAWTQKGEYQFYLFTILYIIICYLSVVFSPSLIPSIILLVFIFLSIGAVGFGPFISATIFLLSSSVIGCFLLKIDINDKNRDLTPVIISIIIGVSIYITAVGWTSGLKIHYSVLHFLIIIVPLLLRPIYIIYIFRIFLERISPNKIRWSNRYHILSYCLANFFIFLHLIPVLLPQANNDALALHLAVPSIINIQKYWQYDVHNYILAAQPLGVSWFILPSYLLGGEFGARFLNFFMFVLTFFLISLLSRRYVSAGMSWLIASIYASTPLVSAVTANIFSENLLTIMIFCGYVSFIIYRENSNDRYLYAGVIILATSITVKLLGLFAALLIFFVILYTNIRKIRILIGLSIIGIVCASYPYLFAYVLTENPLFPYMNNVFQSALFPPEAFKGVSRPFPSGLYELTFSTARFFDGGGQDGSFGFAFLVLAPLCVLAIGRKTTYLPGLFFAAAITIIVSTMTLAEPNIRYFYSALPFVMVVLAVAVSRMQAASQNLYRSFCIVAVTLVGINAYATPLSGWAFKDFPLRTALLRDGVDAWRDRVAPERRAIEFLNLTRGMNYRVALFSRPTLIDVKGEAVFTNWYNMLFSKRILEATHSDQLRDIMRQRRMTHFIAFQTGSGNANGRPVVEQFLARFTVPVFRVGDVAVMQWNESQSFSDELVKNGSIDKNLDGWNLVGSPPHNSSAGSVTVTATAAIWQDVPIDERVSYRYTLRVRCPEPNTLVRLQVIWRDSTGESLETTFLPRACPSESAPVFVDLMPPATARSAIVYVTGHQGEAPVEVSDISLRW